MANHHSAKVRIGRNARRNSLNKSRIGAIRTFVKGVEKAITDGDRDAAKAALQAVQPQLARGVRSGVLHKNTAARRMSRLSVRVKALG